MMTVNIRQQGGETIMAIPPHVMKKLDIDVGEPLQLELTSESFIVHPIHERARHHRKRLTIKELLQGVSSREMAKLNKQTKWAREGDSRGRELA